MVLKGTLIILIFGIACNPKLEQPNVPICFSFRLDNDFDTLLFQKDVQNLLHLNIKNIGVELIVKNDSSFNPSFENIQKLNYVINFLQKKSLNIHIILSKLNHESIFVPDSLLSVWNFKYQKLIHELLQKIKSYNFIKSFTFAVDFQNIELQANLYQNFLIQTQKRLDFPILYSSLLSKTIDCSLHKFSNHIGIFYEPHPSDKYKKLARSLHPLISKYYQEKKIFITHANIQGHDAKLQLQNLLRFWDFKNLSLVNINSIYNQSVISRDNAYFSLKNNAEFLQYIQEYVQ